MMNQQQQQQPTPTGMVPPAYPAQQPSQQQQWNQQMMYPSQPPAVPRPPPTMTEMKSQPQQQPQYYQQPQQNYQQQIPGTGGGYTTAPAPPPQQPSPMIKPPVSAQTSNHGDLHLNNQMSNLSLNNNVADQSGMTKNNEYQQNNLYQNNSNADLSNSNQQQFAPKQQHPGSFGQQQQPQPPPQQQSQNMTGSPQNYNQMSGTNYNYPAQPPPTTNWNQQSVAVGGYKMTNNQQQQQPQPSGYGYNQQHSSPYDQQHNGTTGYQSVYSSYQPPPPQSMGSPTVPNQFQSFDQGQTGYGGMMRPGMGQQQNKLDPDAMPSVVQVIMEDKAKYESNSNVLFTTTIPATVPPLVTTIMENENQIVEDGGCARPQFVRPTIYQVPVTDDNLKTSDIPFGVVIKPFDDQEVERKIYVPITPSPIVRCNRCKAYMNPYNRFVDGGRRFQCSLCNHVTEVPPNYFANLDHTGQRLDKLQLPELYLGSYEYLTTEEYCRNNVMNNRRPHLIFACELTDTSKPILSILSKNLINVIKSFPRDPINPDSAPPMFGFITYNSKIQIYDIVNNGHASVICDLSQPFAPSNTFLVDPLIHMDKIESFLANLPQLYANEELEMQTILGPVIEAALMTTQVDVSNWINRNIVNKIVNDNQQNQSYETIPAGKIYLFHCNLPTFGSDTDTPGRLKQRWTNSMAEIRKLLGTDKEKTILSPESNKYYVQLGQKCVTDYATGVELFLFPPANECFLDIATLGEMTRLTGTGAIFRFMNNYSDSFLTDLRYSLNSSFAFDCVLKVRTSTGIRPNAYYGYYYSRSPSDVECAAINTSTNLMVELKHDDKMSEDEHVVIQAAILYTSLCGQRRVRIHNISLGTCTQIGDVYRNACCDTVVNFLARNAVHHLRNGEKSIQQTKEAIVSRVINILTAYRKHCAQPGTSLGQLILPEALKILPMYICGLLKCDAIDGGPEINPDDKAYAQLKMLGAYISLSQVFLYPRLYKIEYENETEDSLKYSQIRCSAYKLVPSALAYVLENGFYILFLLTTNGCSNVKFLNGLFGPHVDSATKIPMDMALPNLMTNESQFMDRLFKKIENERRFSYKIFIIRQGIDKTESVFKSFLYEDQKIVTRPAGDSKLEGLSYVDLLCHLHKEIRAQLN